MNRSYLCLLYIAAFGAIIASLNCGGTSKQPLQSAFTQSQSLAISTTSLPDGVVQMPYTVTLQATGGSGAKTWSIVSGSLPPGLNLDGSSGTISGTSSSQGQYQVGFKLQDSSGTVASPLFNFFMNPPLQIGELSAQSVNRGDFYMAAINSNTLERLPFSIHWTILSPSLPPGLGLLPDPHLPNQLIFSGIPRRVGTFSFSLQAQDSSVPQQTVTKTFTVSVGFGRADFKVPVLPRATVGVAYSFHFVPSAGLPPFRWTGSSLPAGLTLSPDGLLSGTPTTPTSSNSTGIFSVTLQDSSGSATGGGLSLLVAPNFLGRNDSLGSATVIGDAGTFITLSGSISPYSDSSSTGADSDYFKFTAPGGAVVSLRAVSTVNIFHTNALDTVLELLDANGRRFETCNNPEDDNVPPPLIKDSTPGAFDDDCINDDESAVGNSVSALSFQVPGNSGSPVTFYVHVLDWRGDARPDMKYELTLTRLQ